MNAEMKNVYRQFDIGDRVALVGQPHNPDHTGPAVVKLVNGNAYGLEFDVIPGSVHKWYVDNELELIEEENMQGLPGQQGYNYSKKLRTVRNLSALKAGTGNWYRIENKSGVTEVSIYDEIGWFGVTAKDFRHDLSKISTDRITLNINSPGGEVFDGIDIYNALVAHSAAVDVVIGGMAASIASVIAMAGDTVTMAATATMMIHDGFGLCIGNQADMLETAELLGKTSDNIASIYAAKTGKSVEYFRGLMKDETWFTGQEAMDEGLADAVTPRKGEEAKNYWDMSVFKNYKRVAGEIQDTASAVHHTATEDSAWDKNAAVSAMPNKASVLRYCHAWRDADGDPDEKKTYKFPHHRTEGGPANIPACRNGLSRLPGSKIPEGDKAGVKSHLQAHLDDYNEKNEGDFEPMAFEDSFDPDFFREAFQDAIR